MKEPNCALLGYVKLNEENAEIKQKTLHEFFNEKNISFENLIGICCDGENVNTGEKGGIIRLFEKQLKRPLHWFICLLHFNELPFRHLYETLDKSKTTGPRSSTGVLSKQIAECENLQVSKLFFKYDFFIFFFWYFLSNK